MIVARCVAPIPVVIWWSEPCCPLGVLPQGCYVALIHFSSGRHLYTGNWSRWHFPFLTTHVKKQRKGVEVNMESQRVCHVHAESTRTYNIMGLEGRVWTVSFWSCQQRHDWSCSWTFSASAVQDERYSLVSNVSNGKSLTNGSLTGQSSVNGVFFQPATFDYLRVVKSHVTVPWRNNTNPTC